MVNGAPFGLDVFDVHVHITTGSAHADDFMSTRQGRYHSFANGTGGTHDDYFHHYILTEAAWRLFAERSADRDEARRDEPCAREHSECISSVVISEEASRPDTA